jgi:formiminotetrahydrofolate cyclodeaminase
MSETWGDPSPGSDGAPEPREKQDAPGADETPRSQPGDGGTSGWSTAAGQTLPAPTIIVEPPVASQRIQRFLDELASDAPTPGGGAWAAISASAGAAMIAMVARLTIKKKGFEAVAERMEKIAHECDDETFALLGLADRDAYAYREVMAAYKLPKGTSEEQHTWSFTLQRALERAADIPLEVARRAVYLMGLAEEALSNGNPNAASDAYSAAAALHAAALAAIANMEINAITFIDKTRQQELADSASSLRNRAQSLLREVGDAFVIVLHS